MDTLYDLDVPYNEKELSKIIDVLVENKFYFLAISKDLSLDHFSNEKLIDDPNSSASRKAVKTKVERQQMRSFLMKELIPPDLAPYLTSKAKRLAEINGKQVRLLTRINIRFDSANEQVVKLFFKEFEKSLNQFDIISATPSNSDLFMIACTLPNIDIISLDLNKSNQRDMPFSGKHLKQAFKTRSIHAEIKISPILHCPSAKSACVYLFTELQKAQCEKAFIISSGALTEWDIRSGFSITCLARAFGMQPQLALHTISRNPQKAFEHALIRKNTTQGAMAIIKLSQLGGVLSVEPVTSKGSIEELARSSDDPISLKRKSDSIDVSDNLLPSKKKKHKHFNKHNIH